MIIYFRDVYYNFFSTCSNMLNENQHIESIVNQSMKANIDLSKISVNFQTDVMEKMFQIEKKFGCSYMVRIPHVYKTDNLMINAVKTFTYATIKCYYNALKLRFQKNDSKLRKTGVIMYINIYLSIDVSSYILYFNIFFDNINRECQKLI